MKKQAVVVGGSIAGVSCVHALTRAGWDVVVIEKSRGPPTGSPTGAGVGIDRLSQQIIRSWIRQPAALDDVSLPLSISQDRAVSDRKIGKVLVRDEHFNHIALHWADLHGLLYNSLPPAGVAFLWGHLFLSFSVSSDKKSVKVKSKVIETGEIVEVEGHLLVGADGSRSSVRQCLLPDLKLRYTGYCAWRGVLDYAEIEDSDIMKRVRETYPDLGKSIYFDLAMGSHSVLVELPNKRFNWLWYTNRPEPELKGASLTMKERDDTVERMHREAEKIWPPAFIEIVRLTKEPFVNAMYDSDPLEKISWDDVVVLVGDAAHPTTPHCARSTNMSILDAEILGKCLKRWGPIGKLGFAIGEYQAAMLPFTSAQVLKSRKVGRIKQGLMVYGLGGPFDPDRASSEAVEELEPRTFVGEIPVQVKGDHWSSL